MSIFTECDGGVVKVPYKNCTSAVKIIGIDGIEGVLPVTGFSLDLSTNHQFLHALNEFVYAFAFGDRIGELTVSGICFTAADSTCPRDGIAGISNVLTFYQTERFSVKTAAKTITIDGMTFKGFLTGARVEIPNPALPIAQWVMRYNVLLVAGAPSSVAGGPRQFGRPLPSPDLPRLPRPGDFGITPRRPINQPPPLISAPDPNEFENVG
jgi:hypothetical protein